MGDDVPTLVLVTGPPGTGKSTLAEVAADALGASVLSWDWVMAALRPMAALQVVIDRLDHVEHRRVGWAVLWSVATAQLRHGRSVVLDGTARQIEVDETRSIARAAGGRSRVVVTSCGDLTLHRERIEGRDRDIAGWYELDWSDVVGFLDRWDPPVGADLYLDTAASFGACARRLDDLVRPATTSPPAPTG